MFRSRQLLAIVCAVTFISNQFGDKLNEFPSHLAPKSFLFKKPSFPNSPTLVSFSLFGIGATTVAQFLAQSEGIKPDRSVELLKESFWFWWILVLLILSPLALLIYKSIYRRVMMAFPRDFPNEALPNVSSGSSSESRENTFQETLAGRRPRGGGRQTWRLSQIGRYHVMDNGVEETLGTKVSLTNLEESYLKGEAYVAGNYLILTDPIEGLLIPTSIDPQGRLGSRHKAYRLEPSVKSPSFFICEEARYPVIKMQTSSRPEKGYWILSEFEGVKLYKAWDPRSKRTVVIKTFPLDSTLSLEERQSLRQEAPNLLKVCLSSPYLLLLREMGEAPVPYFVFDEFDRSLKIVLNKFGKLNLSEILEVGLQVAKGVHDLHQKGMVHGDIEPDNLFYKTTAERNKFFCLAYCGSTLRNHTSAKILKGGSTEVPYYWAPEQFEGEAVEVRSDVYSLGALLFRLANGCVPYAGKSLEELKANIKNGKRAPFAREILEKHPDLVQVIEKAMALKKEDRFQTVAEMAHALAAIKGGHPVMVRLPRELLRTTILIMVYLTTVTALAIAALFFFLHKNKQPERSLRGQVFTVHKVCLVNSEHLSPDLAARFSGFEFQVAPFEMAV